MGTGVAMERATKRRRSSGTITSASGTVYRRLAKQQKEAGVLDETDPKISSSSSVSHDLWWSWQAGENLLSRYAAVTTATPTMRRVVLPAAENDHRKKTERILLERTQVPVLGDLPAAPAAPATSTTTATTTTTTTAAEPATVVNKWPFKTVLKARYEKVMKEKELSPLQQLFAHHFRAYRDVTFFDRRLLADGPHIAPLYALHAVDHVLRLQDLILKNNDSIRAKTLAGQEPPEKKDQGFTRPSVLILLPFKNIAKEVIEHILAFSGAEVIHHQKRFETEFGLTEDETDMMDREDKPMSYRVMFRGNMDDHFRMGLKLSRKTARLYHPFDKSDIIVASPLGLQTILDDTKETGDFLSSLSIVIMDLADVFLMQNPQHPAAILTGCNGLPKKTERTDFSRVRDYFLSNESRHVRQFLFFSQVERPELRTWRDAYSQNANGQVILLGEPPQHGILDQCLQPADHLFQCLACKDPKTVDDAKFDYFQKIVYPKWLKASPYNDSPTILFFPTYYDFVRVRGFLRKQEEQPAFLTISEYTTDAEISRARSHFYHGKTSLLLLTERSHFFRRFLYRHPSHILLYGLPVYPQTYVDLANMLHTPEHVDGSGVAFIDRCSLRTIVTPLDAPLLRTFVGPKRTKQILEKQLTQFAIDL